MPASAATWLSFYGSSFCGICSAYLPPIIYSLRSDFMPARQARSTFASVCKQARPSCVRKSAPGLTGTQFSLTPPRSARARPPAFGGCPIPRGAPRGDTRGQAPAARSSRASPTRVPLGTFSFIFLSSAPQQRSRRRPGGPPRSGAGDQCRIRVAPAGPRSIPERRPPPDGAPRAPRFPQRLPAAAAAAAARHRPGPGPRPRPRPAALPGGRLGGSLLLAAAGFLSPGFRAPPSHPPPERDGVRAGGRASQRGCAPAPRGGGGCSAARRPFRSPGARRREGARR